MTALLAYNWFWLLLFGSVGLAALVVSLVIIYQLMRIATALENLEHEGHEITRKARK